MNLLGQAHKEMHDQGVMRVHSDVRITTRYVSFIRSSPVESAFQYFGESLMLMMSRTDHG